MINAQMKERAWVERYRPQNLDECILPTRLKNVFEEIASEGYIKNMLFYGRHGTGKTTTAEALCKQLGYEWIKINGSNQRGLDVIRETITRFASTVSLLGEGSGKKCVIVDEADNLTGDTQSAFRGAIEEFSNCSFIFTCNYKNKILPALMESRFGGGIDFNPTKEEMDRNMAVFYRRVESILGNEGVKYDPKAVIDVVKRFYPDNRRILLLLQQYSRKGEIDAGIYMAMDQTSVEGLINFIKEKKFKEIRQWCADNASNDLSTLYKTLYDRASDIVQKSSYPNFILILEDYQRYDTLVADREIHLSAMMVEIMTGLELK